MILDYEVEFLEIAIYDLTNTSKLPLHKDQHPGDLSTVWTPEREPEGEFVSCHDLLIPTAAVTHNSSPGRQIRLYEILPAIPFEWRSEESCTFRISAKSSKDLIVRVQYDLISPHHFDSHSIVGEALCRMEVEDPEKPSSFEDNHFVDLVFQANIRLL